MATENDTAVIASERYVPLHSSSDHAHLRGPGSCERSMRVLMLDSQAPACDLASLVESRADRLLALLDILLPGVDEAISRDDVVRVVYPHAEELAGLSRALAGRLAPPRMLRG
jgi:hypothetical protein